MLSRGALGSRESSEHGEVTVHRSGAIDQGVESGGERQVWRSAAEPHAADQIIGVDDQFDDACREVRGEGEVVSRHARRRRQSQLKELADVSNPGVVGVVDLLPPPRGDVRSVHPHLSVLGEFQLRRRVDPRPRPVHLPGGGGLLPGVGLPVCLGGALEAFAHPADDEEHVTAYVAHRHHLQRARIRPGEPDSVGSKDGAPVQAGFEKRLDRWSLRKRPHGVPRRVTEVTATVRARSGPRRDDTAMWRSAPAAHRQRSPIRRSLSSRSDVCKVEGDPMSELVIRGGTVVDGTGSPGRQADVAIDGGRITAIGRRLDGERVLNAEGHVVAPGFIDIHTHYDAQVFWDPCLTPSCFHGVTTVVAGNCGFSIAPTRSEHRDLIAHTLENVEDMDVSALRAGIPWDFSTFPEYLASVERHGLGLNFAAYLGHTALRLFVMGDDAYERAATPEEITRMQAVLKEGLEAGAAGFATSSAPTHFGAGGKRIPSRFAERQELEALLATLGSVGRGAAGFAPGDVPIDDLYDLQLATGVPFTYGALLTFPTGQHRRLLEVNRSGWDRGAQVWPQVSPRPLCFTMKMTEPFTLNLNPIFAELIGAPVAARVQAYADPAWRQKVLDAWAESTRMAPRWDTYVFAESVHHPEVIGRRLLDLADRTGRRTSRCPPRSRGRRARAAHRQLLGQRRHRRGRPAVGPGARHPGSLRRRRPCRPAL